MKKYLFPALALGLVMTSCQSDEPFAPVEGGEKQVTFTLNVPGELGTRAGATGNNSGVGGFSNGQGTLSYTLVLTAKGDSQVLKATGEDKEVVFTPTVVLGREYTVTAYAHFGDALDSLTAIEITKHFNDETKDAYTWTGKINFATDQDGTNQNITLTRPFGKLRLVATDYVAGGESLNTKIESVKVTYTDCQAATFNATTGLFDFANYYVNTTEADAFDGYYQQQTEGATTLTTLFADYLPANSQDNMVDFTVTVKYADSNETYSRTFNDIPVRRNALTTLKGNFFTAGANISVVVDEDFDGGQINMGTETKEVDEVSELIAAIKDSNVGKVVLTDDIDMSETLAIGAPSNNPAPTRSESVAASRNLVIDLNGKTVTSTAKKAFEVYTNATFKNGVIKAANRCIDTRTAVNLVLNDVTLIADEYTSSYGNPQPLTIGGSENGTEVTMNNVNISAGTGYGIITFVKTNLTATNSTISGYSALYVKPGSDNSEFNFKNTELSGSTANNDVEGNSFSTIAPRANNVTINVDEDSKVIATGNYCYALSLGSKSIKNEEEITGAKVTILGTIEGNILAGGKLNDNTIVVDDKYKDALEAKGYKVEIVDEKAVITAKIVSTADELVAALKDGQNVYLKNDITVAATKGGYNKAGILQNKAQTIDGGGHTLTVTGAGATYDCAIYTNGGTIKNLTVAGAMRGIFTAGQSSDLHIENVEFKDVIYTFNSDGKMPANPFGVYVSNSKVNGWTSHSDMHTEVVYTNCSFGEGSTYKFCRPYGKTSFVKCTFCPGYKVDDSKTNDITFTDCTWKK